MIDTIENGMELSRVRSILNELIERVNELDGISNSYNDLEDLPAIDGIPLTSESKMSDFAIPATSMEDFSGLTEMVAETAAKAAAETAEESISDKLSCDFSKLEKLEYEFDKSMTIAICTDKGVVLSATLGDLITYLKHSVLKLNDQYLRVIQ